MKKSSNSSACPSCRDSLFRGSEVVRLTPKAAELLLLLVQHHGRLLTGETLGARNGRIVFGIPRLGPEHVQHMFAHAEHMRAHVMRM